MMLWSRLKHSRLSLRVFSNEFKRSYYLNPSPVIANQHISSRKFVPVVNHPRFIVEDEQLALFQIVRFYKKHLQNGNQKIAKRDESEPRRNEEIMAPMVRLVIDEDNHFIIPRHEALARARSQKLDLVEVDRHGKPPVCKILDYNKQKYLQQTKEKERAKSKSTLKSGAAKEVRFCSDIKLNDLKIKADMAMRLMEKGYRVKCMAVAAKKKKSGEQVNEAPPELSKKAKKKEEKRKKKSGGQVNQAPCESITAEGQGQVNQAPCKSITTEGDFKRLLSQFTDLINDVAIIESVPKYEKKQAFIVVRHVKYGPAKKPGKKASVADAADDSSQTTEDSDEDAQTNNAPTKQSERADFDEDDDTAHTIFEMDSKESRHLESSRDETPYSMDRNVRRVVEPLPPCRPSYVPPGKPVPPCRPSYVPPGIPKPAFDPRSAYPVTMNRTIPNQGTQPRVGMETSPRTRPGQQAQAPTRGIPKQGSSDSNNPNEPAKSYGIFSAPKVNTSNQGQNAPAPTNRYQQNAPSDSNRNPRTIGRSPQRGSPAADSSSGQGRWGIFSAEKNEN